MATGEAAREQRPDVASGARAGATLVLLIALAALLRGVQVGSNGFDLDETWSIWMARQDVGTIVASILFERSDATPPTFYVLLHPLLALSEDSLAVRAISIVAGVACVWVTYSLAAYLFDRRLAMAAGLLVAAAPFHIQFSQVGRAYMLASLWAVVSLYFLARIVFGQSSRLNYLGLVLASAAAMYTFYVTALVLVFNNLVVLVLVLSGRLSRAGLIRWVQSQVALGVLLLPILLPAAMTFTRVEPGRGQSWLGRPGLESLVKTAILFTTGDPSYGPTGVTPARVLSLGLIVFLGLAALIVVVRRGWYRRLDTEGGRVLFLSGAAFVPWATAFAVAQFRPIYHEKYLLFVIPPMAILVVWVISRIADLRPRFLVSVVLSGLVASALYVQLTEPEGEQWREAVAQVRAELLPGDGVTIAPGFYGRPFAYYFSGEFPSDIKALSRFPAVAMNEGPILPLVPAPTAGAAEVDPAPLTGTHRVWYLYGYAPVDERVGEWVESSFVTERSWDYLGAHVRLLRWADERRADAGSR